MEWAWRIVQVCASWLAHRTRISGSVLCQRGYMELNCTVSFFFFFVWKPLKAVKCLFTHRWAIPAFRTALEMAFTAVHREFSSVVNSPVPFAFLPSSMTNRVTVTTLVSNVPRSDIMAVLGPISQKVDVVVRGEVRNLNALWRRTLLRGVKLWRPMEEWRRGVASVETRPALYTHSPAEWRNVPVGNTGMWARQ